MAKPVLKEGVSPYPYHKGVNKLMETLKNKNSYDSAVESLDDRVQKVLLYLPSMMKDHISEVRLREGQPLAVQMGDRICFVSCQSKLTDRPGSQSFIVTREDIASSIRTMSRYSVHTHQHEIREGYLSVAGGHRAGLGGSAVLEKDGVANLREITSINLRIARDIRGCADQLVERIFSRRVQGVLIAGAPGSGKTTLLRDLGRQLSSGVTGRYLRVAVVDERCEIGGTAAEGRRDLGVCTGLLSGCPKGEGILMALRSLSPDLILCDEVGKEEEIRAVSMALNSGVPVVATIHASTLEELLARPQGVALLHTGAFQKVVLLEGAASPCKIKSIVEAGDFHAPVGRAFADSSLL